MDYVPFRFSEHRKLQDLLLEEGVDFALARSIHNVRYSDGVLRFSLGGLRDGIEHVLDLNDLGSFESLPSKARQAVLLVLNNLESAERIDDKSAQVEWATQFMVTKAFRGFSQAYGGKRFVHYCRKLIKTNWNKSLFPYMYGDLAVAIYGAYNKSVNKDHEGLCIGIVSFLEEFVNDQASCDSAFSALATRNTAFNLEALYVAALQSPVLHDYAEHSYVEKMLASSTFTLSYERLGSAEALALLSKKALSRVLEKYVPFGEGRYNPVEDYLFSLEKLDDDLALSYAKNPQFSLRDFKKYGFYEHLGDSIRNQLVEASLFDEHTPVKDMVAYYAQKVEGDESRKEAFFEACSRAGKNALVSLLKGEPVFFQAFRLNDIPCLLPYMDLNDENTAHKLMNFMLPFVIQGPGEPEAEEVLKALPSPLYAPLIHRALVAGFFRNRADALAIADRFDLISKLGLKEWNPHAL